MCLRLFKKPTDEQKRGILFNCWIFKYLGRRMLRIFYFFPTYPQKTHFQLPNGHFKSPYRIRGIISCLLFVTLIFCRLCLNIRRLFSSIKTRTVATACDDRLLSVTNGKKKLGERTSEVPSVGSRDPPVTHYVNRKATPRAAPITMLSPLPPPPPLRRQVK